MNYYYLIASLPELALDRQPPLTLAAFEARCAEHLSSADLATLRELLAGRQEGVHAFSVAWQRTETLIRNAVVRHRAARLKRDATPALRPVTGVELWLERAVAEALARPQPQEREWALDQLRWKALDDAAGHNPFSSNALLAYAAKLRLAWRWAAMDLEAGRRALDAFLPKETTAA